MKLIDYPSIFSEMIIPNIRNENPLVYHHGFCTSSYYGANLRLVERFHTIGFLGKTASKLENMGYPYETY